MARRQHRDRGEGETEDRGQDGRGPTHAEAADQPAERDDPDAAAQQKCGKEACRIGASPAEIRSEEHTSELQSLMRISYAVFCLKKKKDTSIHIKKIVFDTTSTKVFYVLSSSTRC